MKEEKLLLIALEANEEKAVLDAMTQVIKNCALAPLNVESLAIFDLEYIFLVLRARSVNNILELTYRCRNKIQIEDKVVQCDNLVKCMVNLDEVKVQFHPNHTKQIFLTETMGVNMRYPNVKTTKFTSEGVEAETVDAVFLQVANCVESVFDDTSVYTNFTPKEIQEWLEKLTQPQFLKLQQFFETMPKLEHDLLFECPRCKYKETIHIKGLSNFFV